MKRKFKIAVVLCLLLSAAGGLAAYAGLARRNHAHAAARPEVQYIEFSSESPGRFRVTDEAIRFLGVQSVEVKPAARKLLAVSGSLSLDVDRIVRVRTPSPGKLFSAAALNTAVEKGQVVALLSSTNIAAEEYEPTASSNDGTSPEQAKSPAVGTAAQNLSQEARGNLGGDKVASEVRSPIDGVIVEKNFNVGDIVDPSQDLFKIADLSRVLVCAFADDEDRPLLRSLSDDQRKWEIDIKRGSQDEPLRGKFRLQEYLCQIQPGVPLMGWLDNPDGRFNIGQFITATIDLPADPSLVTVPISSLIEDGTCPKVFVAETADARDFTCHSVTVVRRGRGHAYIRSEPKSSEAACGADPLKAGQYVVKSGVLELAAELKSLEAAAREQ